MVYPTEIFLFVAFIYFVMCSGLELGANALMRRYSLQRQPRQSWLARLFGGKRETGTAVRKTGILFIISLISNNPGTVNGRIFLQ